MNVPLTRASSALLLALSLAGCGGKEDAGGASTDGEGGSTVSHGTVGTAAGGTSASGSGTGATAAGSTSAGGTGGTTAHGTDDFATMPESCQLASDAPELALERPQGITFSMTNNQATTLYFHFSASCTPGLVLYSCADDYENPLPHTAACTLSCDGAGDYCIACSACMSYYEAIDPGATVTREWAGTYFTFDSASGCACHDEWTAPAGKYRATIPVYSSNDDTSGVNEPTLVSVDFTYPDADGVVELSL